MSLVSVVVISLNASATPVFSDGFESGTTAAWTTTMNFSVQQLYVRSGSFAGEAISAGTGKTFLSETLSSPQSVVYARVWFDVVSLGTKATLMRFRSGLNKLVTVAVTTKNALTLTDSFNGTTYTTPSGLVSKGGWHVLQIHVDVTGGRVDVWLDGSSVSKLSISIPLGTVPISKVELGESSNARTYDIAFDDVAIDTAYIGPSIPTGVQGTAPSSGEVDLSWDPPTSSDPPVTHTIYRSADPSDPNPPSIGTSAGNTFVDGAVSGSSTYYYWIDSVDPVGAHSARSDPPVKIDTPAPSGSPPGQPQGLAASAPSAHRVDLTWQPNPSSDGVKSYLVYRAPDAITTPVLVGTVLDTSFSDASVQPQTSYLYSIRAHNGAGDSPDSTQVPVTTPSDADPVIAAAGDIACDPADAYVGGSDAKHCQQTATSNLLGQRPYAAILPLGDEQYECGGLSAFQQVYGASWGQSAYYSITMPVPGNHEYNNNVSSSGTDCSSLHNGQGFYSYFSQAPYNTTVNCCPAKGWYSYDIGGWHIVALNAECGYIHTCDVGSPEETWLIADLAAHPSGCTMAYWHQPRWADGSHVSDPSYGPFWQDLYAAGAELVLNGHEHMYERFLPQDPAGNADLTTGITQITVGTGGGSHGKPGVPLPNRAVVNSDTYGILQVTLHPNSYEWKFAPASVPGGGTFTEQGAAMCHGTP